MRAALLCFLVSTLVASAIIANAQLVSCVYTTDDGLCVDPNDCASQCVWYNSECPYIYGCTQVQRIMNPSCFEEPIPCTVQDWALPSGETILAQGHAEFSAKTELFRVKSAHNTSSHLDA